MANIVSIGDTRYLVDVGYGADGPSQPLPLVSGTSLGALPGQEISLRHENLSQHQDPVQRVWIYATRKDFGSWNDVYHFAETEFFPADFDVLNYYNMSFSSFAKTIVVQRFLLEENAAAENPCGVLLLIRDQLFLRKDGSQETLEIFRTEDQRLTAFRKYFDIVLTQEQAVAIRGASSELKERVQTVGDG
jgi:arylamine N-acetyltransferase